MGELFQDTGYSFYNFLYQVVVNVKLCDYSKYHAEKGSCTLSLVMLSMSEVNQLSAVILLMLVFKQVKVK